MKLVLEIPEAARIAAVLQRYFIHQGMPSADSESVPPAPGKRVLLTLSMAPQAHWLCSITLSSHCKQCSVSQMTWCYLQFTALMMYQQLFKLNV